MFMAVQSITVFCDGEWLQAAVQTLLRIVDVIGRWVYDGLAAILCPLASVVSVVKPYQVCLTGLLAEVGSGALQIDMTLWFAFSNPAWLGKHRTTSAGVW